jgi:nucleotide-binding universal stress UspA family protein
MGAFSKILLCYDSSREGRRALIQGAELAQQVGAETHLLAIAPAFDSAMVDAPSAVAIREHDKSIEDVLREGVEKLRARGLSATGHLVFGDPIEQIPAVARDLGVDLIVVGHRPCGAIARWWAGRSNAQILDRIDCSILVSIDTDESTA